MGLVNVNVKSIGEHVIKIKSEITINVGTSVKI